MGQRPVRAERIRTLETLLSPTERFRSLALQLVVYERRNGKAVPTGRRSRVYGGTWDRWRRAWCAIPPTVVYLPCSASQLDFIEEKKRKAMALGGRGSGKSEGLVLWALVLAVDNPGWSIQLTSPTYKKTVILWRKILRKTNRHWLKPRKKGIRLTDREIRFVHGSVFRFFSAADPDSLRGEDNHAAGIDERQDVSQEAVDNVFLSLRITDRYQLRQIGTPKMGTDFHEEHNRYLDDDDACVHRMGSLQNPFIPSDVFDDAAKNMDEHRYRQEVLAEFVPLEGLVYWLFDRRIHMAKIWPNKNRDITRSFTAERFGKGFDYVLGCDYNVAPMCAVVYKLIAPENRLEQPVMWAVDEVSIPSDANATKLGVELQRRGYSDAVVIDDASGQGGKGGQSSAAMLRQLGFVISHPKKNPPVVDRVNAVLAKLKNADGAIGYRVDPKCKMLIRALESQDWENGKPNKRTGHDHILDAAGYPVHRLFPAHIDYANRTTFKVAS